MKKSAKKSAKKSTTKPAARKGGAKTIDEYLNSVTPDQRVALERLRKTIRATARAAATDVEECISYQIPAFRVGGKVMVWFAATKNHCSFFPGGIVQAFKDELDDYEISKGTIRFQPDHPLPAALVRRIVKARIAQQS
jgi:uncharacterized protein YdhG (YjbR/CyaY superfamily)